MGDKYTVFFEAGEPKIKLLSDDEWVRWRTGDLDVKECVVDVDREQKKLWMPYVSESKARRVGKVLLEHLGLGVEENQYELRLPQNIQIKTGF